MMGYIRIYLRGLLNIMFYLLQDDCLTGLYKILNGLTEATYHPSTRPACSVSSQTMVSRRRDAAFPRAVVQVRNRYYDRHELETIQIVSSSH